VVPKQASCIFKRWQLLLLIVFILCQSCTPINVSVITKSVESTQDGAEILFINGDFENALIEYEQIYKTAATAEAKNLALYGLACTQLMIASSDVQRIEAISNLQKWDATKGSAPFIENHHLLILALKQQADQLQQKNKNLIKREKNKNSLISSQKMKIAQMASIVEKLQKQLEELEAIDEIFQGKRKPL